MIDAVGRLARRVGGSLLQVALAAVVALGLCTACTVQDRYESLRQSQLGNCDRQVTERLQEECRQRLQEAMPESYPAYERQRRQLPPQ